MYGPVTVRQVMDGKHVKRGIKAHLTSLQALFQLYAEAFFKAGNEDIHDLCLSQANKLKLACANGDTYETRELHKCMTA